jgi:hypothetical protein
VEHNIAKVEELAASVESEAVKVSTQAALVTEEAQKEAVEAAESHDEEQLAKVCAPSSFPMSAFAAVDGGACEGGEVDGRRVACSALAVLTSDTPEPSATVRRHHRQ